MTRALVLGGGAGIAAPWEAGLIEGFRRAGTDLGEADVIVGSSWGSFVGACLAHGADLDRCIEHVIETDREQRGPGIHAALLQRMLRLLSDTSVPGRTRRRRVGEISRRPEVVERSGRLDLITECLPATEWPDRPLIIPAVDADTGERAVWRRGDPVPLPKAVRASASWPTEFPPTEIDGNCYMDAGTYSSTNADLAEGCDRVVVLMPMRHLVPPVTLRRELDRLGAAEVAVVGPDDLAVELFALELFEPNIPDTAYAAGLRQAADEVPAVAGAWHG
ncbi:patatin-like phospholipase family protein [Actinomadura atramentaria]|uniref:patatin-like phospholipase family protein n=1 Tax=Actinomadura atramentaria TaxID=1990 RepID=UPI00035DB995|nr:patatin-like phospholipase family protein [Actinomadura atramentaria]